MRKGLESRLPFRLCNASASDSSSEMLKRLFGDVEGRRSRPVHCLLGKPHLLDTEGFAVSGGGVLLMRAAKADVRADSDQRWPGRFSSRAFCQRERNSIDIIALLHSLHVPAERGKPGHAIFCKRQLCASLDRDVVVCI
jgi:hypothetical protein